MPLLSPHLAFAPGDDPTSSLPPRGSHLVVSDTLTAPSHFAVLHLVLAAVSSKVPVIWVDLRLEGRASWDAIARRLGTPLPSSPSAFVHIQPTPLPSPPGSTPPSLNAASAPALYDPNPTLRPTFDAIATAMAALKLDNGNANLGPGPGPTAPALVLLDGLSELAHMGFSVSEITQFVRAVLASSSAAVVSTLHADHLPRTAAAAASTGAQETDADAAALLAGMLRLAGCWWRVSGLASGRSGDVSGEISVHPLGAAPAGVAVPRSAALQYRLEAAGVKMFAKGTGRGFL